MANATAMSRVLDIVSQASREDKVIIISSAISGATDLLIKASTASASQKLEILDSLKHRHFEIIDRLFTGKENKDTKAIISQVDEDLRNAPKADYQSFGEIFSTMILARKLAAEGINTLWLNSTDLIRVESGVVNGALTYRKIKSAVESRVWSLIRR